MPGFLLIHHSEMRACGQLIFCQLVNDASRSRLIGTHNLGFLKKLSNLLLIKLGSLLYDIPNPGLIYLIGR